MARRATIQLKVHGKIVQSVSLEQQDIECLIQGLRLVSPCTPRIGEQRAEWLASDPVDWANKSFAIAREPGVGYCVMVDEGEPERVVVVDDGSRQARGDRAGTRSP